MLLFHTLSPDQDSVCNIAFLFIYFMFDHSFKDIIHRISEELLIMFCKGNIFEWEGMVVLLDQANTDIIASRRMRI